MLWGLGAGECHGASKAGRKPAIEVWFAMRKHPINQ